MSPRKEMDNRVYVPSQKPLFWLLYFIEMCATAFCFSAEEAWIFAPVVQILSLGIMFSMAELGIYPYRGRQQLAAKIAWILFMLPVTLLTNTLADGAPHPLYPTDTPALWAALPFVAFGVGSVLRGFRWV